MLVEVSPRRVVPVAALDPALGLLLTVDQGPSSVSSPAPTSARGAPSWRRAELSAAWRRSTGWPPSACPPSRRPMPRRTSSAAWTTWPDSPRPIHAGLSEDLEAALRAKLPTVRGWADEVAALGLPVTLNHNDLHERNVFVVDDELRFFDFADAMLTEPLAVLHVPAQAARRPALRRARRPPPVAGSPTPHSTSGATSSASLRCVAHCPAALRLSLLPRLEVWLRCSVSMSDAELAEWGRLDDPHAARAAPGPAGRPARGLTDRLGALRGGSSVGQSRGLIILGSWVRAPPALPAECVTSAER